MKPDLQIDQKSLTSPQINTQGSKYRVTIKTAIFLLCNMHFKFSTIQSKDSFEEIRPKSQRSYKNRKTHLKSRAKTRTQSSKIQIKSLPLTCLHISPQKIQNPFEETRLACQRTPLLKTPKAQDPHPTSLQREATVLYRRRRGQPFLQSSMPLRYTPAYLFRGPPQTK
ncbi:hypothetical protein AAC387_Pa03g4438 [Persea americana]